MKQSLLLPHSFKIVGWCLLTPAVLLWIVGIVINDLPELNERVSAIFERQPLFGQNIPFFKTIVNDFFYELVGLATIIGGLLVGFSREKREDEFIARLRLTSLQWAVLVNYGLLILCILFVQGFDFLTVMIYNLFTILLIFIIRFNYILFRTSKQASREK